jgi:hypothetical protein
MNDPHDRAEVGTGQPSDQRRRPRWWFRSAARGWWNDGEEVFVISGPAQGAAFDFDLSVSCRWLRQLSVEPDSYEVQLARMDLRQQLETHLREIARKHPALRELLEVVVAEQNGKPSSLTAAARGALTAQRWQECRTSFRSVDASHRR